MFENFEVRVILQISNEDCHAIASTKVLQISKYTRKQVIDNYPEKTIDFKNNIITIIVLTSTGEYFDALRILRKKKIIDYLEVSNFDDNKYIVDKHGRLDKWPEHDFFTTTDKLLAELL